MAKKQGDSGPSAAPRERKMTRIDSDDAGNLHWESLPFVHGGDADKPGDGHRYIDVTVDDPREADTKFGPKCRLLCSVGTPVETVDREGELLGPSTQLGIWLPRRCVTPLRARRGETVRVIRTETVPKGKRDPEVTYRLEVPEGSDSRRDGRD